MTAIFFEVFKFSFEVQMLQWLGILICVGGVGLSSFQIKIKNRNVWGWEWECPILSPGFQI